MAVTTMFNFDIITGQQDNSAGLNQPVHLIGLAPFANSYGLAWTTTSSGNESLGVTGLAIDKFANGGNALVFFSRTLANAPAIAWNTINSNMTATGVWRYTLGFRFKMSSDSPAALPAAHNLLTFTSQTAVLLQLSTTYNLVFAGTATSTTLVRNREYYFEVVVDHPTAEAGPNYTPTMSLYIDGVFAGTRNSVTFSTSLACMWRLGMVSNGATTSSYRRWMIGDIYTTDVVGDAPYNGRLGPQRCRSFYPDELVSNAWTISEGTDALALITGANARVDSKYLSAPDDASATSYRLNFPTTANSAVNGVFIFARSQRDQGATRSIVASMSKTDGTLIKDGTPVAVGTTFSDQIIGAFTPTNAAEAQNYRDSVLQGAIFAIRAPTT
jgi:hypothetical protein